MIRFVSTFDRGAAVPLPPGGGGSAVPLRPVDPPGVVGPRGLALANGQRPSRALAVLVSARGHWSVAQCRAADSGCACGSARSPMPGQRKDGSGFCRLVGSALMC
jgi:hypothetical protein